MIIGHLPASYIASTLLHPRLKTAAKRMEFLLAGALGAIFPDFDFLYFFLIDGRRHHHHTYWTHFPVVWIGLMAAVAIWLYATRSRRAALALVFALNGFIHMLLDSVVGDIWWLAPWVDKPFSLFHVPSLHSHTLLNFMLHWTFGGELLVVATAVYLWRLQATTQRNN